MNRYFILLFLCLSACSNLPPAIKDAPVVDISYKQATANLAGFKNASVRWGGVILAVENEQNFSLLQVLYYPLNYYGRPKLNQPQQGRFVIKSNEFLDPAVYAKDSELTVAGSLIGDTERTIGNKKLRLPLISVSQIHLWPKFENNYYGYPGYGYGYGGFSHFGNGYPYYYGGFGYYPYNWGGRFWPYP